MIIPESNPETSVSTKRVQLVIYHNDLVIFAGRSDARNLLRSASMCTGLLVDVGIVLHVDQVTWSTSSQKNGFCHLRLLTKNEFKHWVSYSPYFRFSGSEFCAEFDIGSVR